MAAGVFNKVDWQRLGVLFLSSKFRRAQTWSALVGVLLYPVSQVNDAFLAFRRLVNRDAAYSPQSGVLESLLLNRFIGRAIRVKVTNGNLLLEGVLIDQELVMTEEETYIYGQMDTVLPAEEVYISEEATYVEVADFTIEVTQVAGETITEAEVRRIADRYKTYGTIYSVVIL
jgi:hypothetical protein